MRIEYKAGLPSFKTEVFSSVDIGEDLTVTPVCGSTSSASPILVCLKRTSTESHGLLRSLHISCFLMLYIQL